MGPGPKKWIFLRTQDRHGPVDRNSMANPMVDLMTQERIDGPLSSSDPQGSES
jgi:hypothetical protein